MSTNHAFPALHNAMWPGLVGKGPDSEPPIDLDTMIELTATARADGAAHGGHLGRVRARRSAQGLPVHLRVSARQGGSIAMKDGYFIFDNVVHMYDNRPSNVIN